VLKKAFDDSNFTWIFMKEYRKFDKLMEFGFKQDTFV